jgi:hypothetical protein
MNTLRVWILLVDFTVSLSVESRPVQGTTIHAQMSFRNGA